MEQKNEYKIQSSIECPCHNVDRPIQIMELFFFNYVATETGICSQCVESLDDLGFESL